MSDDLSRLITVTEQWLAAGHGVALATVIETWGSAPRRVGSHLVIRDDGLFEGSLSGGCVEGDVIVEAENIIKTNGFKRLDYGVADATAWEVGLACGGRISVFVQAVTPDRFPPALFAALRHARDNGTTVALQTDLARGTTVAGAGQAPDSFVHVYAPPLRLAVIGAVHIAQALVPIARLIGYAPLVIDPRGLFAGIGAIRRRDDRRRLARRGARPLAPERGERGRRAEPRPQAR